MIGSQEQAGVMRLLPWATPEGKPCYVIGDGTGRVSRLADTVESVQLGMAGEILDHAVDMLADRKATPAQLRFLAARMAEALRDVCRIAESRGVRLGVPECDETDECDEIDETDDGNGIPVSKA